MAIIFTSFLTWRRNFVGKMQNQPLSIRRAVRWTGIYFFQMVELGQSGGSCNILAQHRELYDSGTDNLQSEAERSSILGKKPLD